MTALVMANDFELIGHPEFINQINSQQSQWVAGENQFSGMSYKEFRNTRLGLIVDDEIIERPDPLAEVMKPFISVPTAFDSKEQWPNCMHAIRDQAQCGSCWAFSASEVFSDRWCIETQGKTNEVFSPQEMVSCSDFNMGCNGGRLGAAWNFMCRNGLVNDACYPYTAGQGKSGSCSWGKCTGEGTWNLRHSLKSHTYTTVEAIKQEIYTNGPIQTGFMVYSDFMSYKSGVYKHTSGTLEGGHAVKITGWGQLNGVEYWIVANSWGPKWGLEGYFWLEMNQKELRFEAQGIAGKANTKSGLGAEGLSCWL